MCPPWINLRPGASGALRVGGRGGARHEEPEPISLLRLYKIAHVALYFGIFGPWGFLAIFICDASDGLALGGRIRTSASLNWTAKSFEDLWGDTEADWFIDGRLILLESADVEA